MRTAVICYSYTQNNLMLAREIAARTGGTLIPIEERKSRSRSTIFLDMLFHRTSSIKEYLHLDDRFDHYIFISPVWGGKIASPLKSFIIKEATRIKSYSFISICGGGKDQRPGIEKELIDLLNQKPVAITQLSLTELCKNQLADLINYRIDKEDLDYFNDEVHDFVMTITKSCSPEVTA